MLLLGVDVFAAWHTSVPLSWQLHEQSDLQLVSTYNPANWRSLCTVPTVPQWL